MAALAAAGLTLAASLVSAGSPVGPGRLLRPRPAGPGVTVMTRNLHFGTDFGPVLEADGIDEILAAMRDVFEEVKASRIPERAQALAAEIAAARPDLVGVQEAARWRSEPLSDLLGGSATEYDMLDLLVEALEALGEPYDVVGTHIAAEFSAPALTSGGGCCRTIRFRDREAILVRRASLGKRLRLANARQGSFDARPPGDVGGATPGWVSVDVRLRTRHAFRFVTTHLTPDLADVQAAQGAELLAGPLDTPLPVVLACDCNSPPDGSETPTYGALIAAGLVDAWAATHPADPGPTCCQQVPGLANEASLLDVRVDLVLVRGGPGVASAARVGGEPADRTVSGLWPSDHAGVVAALTLPLKRTGAMP